MAFAAVVSVMNTVEYHIIISQRTADDVYGVLQSLGDTLKRLDKRYYRSIDMSKIDAIDAEIRDAVYKLEDLLEQKGRDWSIYSVLDTLTKLERKYKEELDNPLLRKDDVIHVLPFKKSRTVGLSHQFRRLKSQLLDWTRELKVISLVGMAGIGKTHLALKVFRDPHIGQCFKFGAWVSVGQKDQIHYVLADIVAQIRREPIDRYIKKSILQLKESFQTSFSNWPYLIVLDNMWSSEVCSTLIDWLPASRHGRGILLTTRLEEVAECHCTHIHRMCFLDNEDSWNLLRQNLFTTNSISPQLEKVGRNIAEKCEGLPLLILAVANILSEQEKTEEYWSMVANNKTTTFPDAYDQISKVLSLSYHDLPQQLKVCFLYMGVFPQRSEIPLSKLINLWIVEDFLEIKEFEYLEDLYIECAEKITSKSLAIVCNHSSSGTIKSLRLHSAYWHLCVKEASKKKFFHVFKDLTNASIEDTVGQRRFSVQNNVLLGVKAVYDSMEATSTARSLLCTGPDHQYPVPVCLKFTVLKVLDALAIRFYDFPNQVLKLLQLRYLGLTHNGELPPSIFKLQQLEYLILRQHHSVKRVRDSTFLPMEIWRLQELRHLQITGSKLPDPSRRKKLKNLSTLYVNADSCTEDVFRSTPGLRELGIKIELQPESVETLRCFTHIGLLDELKSLKCVVVNPQSRCQVVAPPRHLKRFPIYLKKLCLNGLGYDWKHMSLISSIPYLAVLKLRCSAFQGPEWETDSEESNCGEFTMLEYLLLEDMDVVKWTTNGNCFPSLRSLIIRYCFKLKEITKL